MKSVTLPAFAKVNLYLEVIGKRPDGYHELVTLFERIDLADLVRIERRPGAAITVDCGHPAVPVGDQNICHKAAKLFLQTLGSKEGVRITLKKNIPVAGGLGGGSSDAAAALMGLQQLFDEPLSSPDLLAIAKGLGSDVPFFLGRTAWGLGRGRGDEVEPQDFEAKLWHLLVAPGFPIPTQEVYGAFSPALTAQKPDVRLILRALRDNHVSTVRSLLFNALEPTVETLYPALRKVKSDLEECGAARPMVSGSGSSVMAVCGSFEEGQGILENFRRRGLKGEPFLAATGH